MEAINDLADLLMYQVSNLYSMEQVFERAFPAIIAKARHSSLKNALTHHANLTNAQKQRLAKIPGLIRDKDANRAVIDLEANIEGFTSRGAAGLLSEINELLDRQLSAEVSDSAIIACVQKIEHYEICSYGTAHAFAKQLHLHKIEQLLDETLQEEYDADDLLTALATAAINKEASKEVFDQNEGFGNSDTGGSKKGEKATSHAEVIITERTINSPGGRAGTSHRRYGTGESRGH
jgi:ferritin-like metal-binding protein YciE